MEWICVKTRTPCEEDVGDVFLCATVTPSGGGHYETEPKTLRFNRATGNWVCSAKTIVTHWMGVPDVPDLCDCEPIVNPGPTPDPGPEPNPENPDNTGVNSEDSET